MVDILTKEKNQNQNKGKAKKIICLNTKEVFESQAEVERKYGILRASIYSCCTGRNKSAGKINGYKAIWMYYDEYLKLTDSQIESLFNERKNIINRKNTNKIICLNTRKVFNNISEAARTYGINRVGICRCCNGVDKTAGKINGERATWMYYDEYLKLKDKQINFKNKDIVSKINKKNNIKNKNKKDNKVICLNTNEIFNSISEASKQYNITYWSINACCNKIAKSGGKINDEKAIWMYYNEYLKLDNNQIKMILNENKKVRDSNRIICLNTKEVFSSITNAEKKYGISKQAISGCCRGLTKTSGEINGERATWMYYDEYLKLDNNQIEMILNENKNKKMGGYSKIICLNTGEVFDSITNAGKKYGISKQAICNCCKGITKTSGKINGERATWMYYNDYLKLNNKELK